MVIKAQTGYLVFTTQVRTVLVLDKKVLATYGNGVEEYDDAYDVIGVYDSEDRAEEIKEEFFQSYLLHKDAFIMPEK